LVETIFDTLNAKAALYALEDAFDEVARVPDHDLRHITDSGARCPADAAGLLEFARPRQAILDRLQLRARRAQMRQHIAEIGRVANTRVCAFPTPAAQ